MRIVINGKIESNAMKAAPISAITKLKIIVSTS